MDPVVSELLLLVVLIALNAFFSASEIAVISVPKLRLKQLSEDGNKTAQVLFRLADDSSRFLATIQIGVTFMGFLASATAAVRLSTELAELIKPLHKLLALALMTLAGLHIAAALKHQLVDRDGLLSRMLPARAL